MEKPKITAYLKTYCGWSNGVRAVLSKYDLTYEEKDIIKHPEYRVEMEQLSGQTLSPSIMVNDTMVADISGEELENYLISRGFIEKDEAPVDVPINSACVGEHAHPIARRSA